LLTLAVIYAIYGVGKEETTLGKSGSRYCLRDLFDFVSKMKTGPIKNLLTQRLKEL